jgi:hypothetical protein
MLSVVKIEKFCNFGFSGNERYMKYPERTAEKPVEQN